MLMALIQSFLLLDGRREIRLSVCGREASDWDWEIYIDLVLVAL